MVDPSQSSDAIDVSKPLMSGTSEEVTGTGLADVVDTEAAATVEKDSAEPEQSPDNQGDQDQFDKDLERYIKKVYWSDSESVKNEDEENSAKSTPAGEQSKEMEGLTVGDSLGVAAGVAAGDSSTVNAIVGNEPNPSRSTKVTKRTMLIVLLICLLMVGAVGLALIFSIKSRANDGAGRGISNDESAPFLIKVGYFQGLDDGVASLEFTRSTSDTSQIFHYLNIEDVSYHEFTNVKNIDDVVLYLTKSPLPPLEIEEDNQIVIPNVVNANFPYRLPDGFLPGDYNGVFLIEEAEEFKTIIAAAILDIIVDSGHNIGSKVKSPTPAPTFYATSDTWSPTSSDPPTANSTGEGSYWYYFTSDPTSSPTPEPSKAATSKPTLRPTQGPTNSPTGSPTLRVTTAPAVNQTVAPTSSTITNTTSAPTVAPTENSNSTATTIAPTSSPTSPVNQTVAPTSSTITSTTSAPTNAPTENSNSTAAPTASPTLAPTTPTSAPTSEPTKEPTSAPTREPTPTLSPTKEPTVAPTSEPTATHTKAPTAAPTIIQTAAPTKAPTSEPSSEPTLEPTIVSSAVPSQAPTTGESPSPTMWPTFWATYWMTGTWEPTEEKR